MKRWFLILCLVMGYLNTIYSQQVSRSKAKEVAETFFNQNVRNDKGATPIQFTDVTPNTDFENFYIFSSDSSFVIVAGDERETPILAFSDKNPLVTENMPDNLHWWLEGYDIEIKYLIENNETPSTEIISAWSALRNGQPLSTRGNRFVSNLLSTEWDQYNRYVGCDIDLYNNYCPFDNNANKRTVTGCTATAMAQIMKYWNFPAHGFGYHDYVPQRHPEYGTQYANFGNTYYEWQNMPNKLNCSSSPTQIDAVAELMRHCGISVDMDYGYLDEGGSGAPADKALKAFSEYFNYYLGAKLTHAYNYTENDFHDLILNELEAGRPVFMSGNSNVGGHAFVCDGKHLILDQFHFNWGFSGIDDGYFTIGSKYPYNISAIIGLHPNNPNLAIPGQLRVAESNAGQLQLSWNMAQGASYYQLFRNGELIASNISNTNYVDSDFPHGPLRYQVISVAADGSTSYSSNTAYYLNPYHTPIPLELESSTTSNTVSLAWIAPENEGKVFQHHPLNFYESQVHHLENSLDTCEWVEVFPDEEVVQYGSLFIYSIEVWVSENAIGKPHRIRLYNEHYEGNEIILSKQDFTFTTNVAGWHTHYLPTPIRVGCGEVDVFIKVDTPDNVADYIETTDSDITSYVYKYFIKSNGKVEYYYKNISPGNHFLINFHARMATEYTYNIYRDGVRIASGVEYPSFVDPNVPNGSHTYYITTNYYGGESEPSNTVQVDVGTSFPITCMTNLVGGTISAPASAYPSTAIDVNVTTAQQYHLNSLYYYTTDPSSTTDITSSMSFIMPESPVTIGAVFEENQSGEMQHTVHILTGIAGGNITSVSLNQAYPGEIISVSVAPNQGQALESLYFYLASDPSHHYNINMNTMKFLMPNDEVTVGATFGSMAYQVRIDPHVEHCTLEASATTATAGTPVEVWLTGLSYGYTIPSFYYYTDSNPSVHHPIVVNNDYTITFTMPSDNVTISAIATTGSTVFDISTFEELELLRDYINEGNDFLWENTFIRNGGEHATFRLTADIDMNPGWIINSDFELVEMGDNPLNLWEPIGTVSSSYNDIINNQVAEGNPFKGVFDGNGHTIRGMFIFPGDFNPVISVGLFGFVSGAFSEIRNLTIENSIVGNWYIGGAFCGILKNSTIQNCNNYAYVYDCYSGYNVSEDFAGGLVGVSIGLSSISLCGNYANLEGTGVGGICGLILPQNGLSGSIHYCTNYGSATISGEGSSGICFGCQGNETILNGCNNYGHIIGRSVAAGICRGIFPSDVSNNNRLFDCRNIGLIETGEEGLAASGICIDFSGKRFSDCTNEGDIHIAGNGNELVAGISFDVNNCDIENCSNEGDILTPSSQEFALEINGIGASSGSIRNCFNRGRLCVAENSYGIGFAFDSIVNCYNLSMVYGAITGSGIGNAEIVFGCHNEGLIYGGIMAAGICVGMSSGSSGNVQVSGRESLIQNCYNTGKIIGLSGFGIAANFLNVQDINIISKCFNTGDVCSPISLGIGEANSTIEQCYNAGSLCNYEESDLELLFGETIDEEFKEEILNQSTGFLGDVLSSSGIMRQCYNVGTISNKVNGDSYIDKVGSPEEIETTVGLFNSKSNYYYDWQMCPFFMMQGRDFENENLSLSTAQMTGDAMLPLLGEENWVYSEGLYPRLKGMSNTDAAIVSASPIYLSNQEKMSSVLSDFTVNVDNNVTWSSKNDAIAINDTDATINEDGDGFLVAKRNNAAKSAYLRTYNVFVIDGDWSNEGNWSLHKMPEENSYACIDAECNVNTDATVRKLLVNNGKTFMLPKNRSFEVSSKVENKGFASGITLEAGSQFFCPNSDVMALLKKDITAYSNDKSGWYTIAMPFKNFSIAEESNMLSNEYDLYRFNETNLTHEEWENYKEPANDFLTMDLGRGYLYANNQSLAMQVQGKLNINSAELPLTNTYGREDELRGFNLIGNPFPYSIYKGAGAAIDDDNLSSGYYVLNNSGAWEVKTYRDPIESGQGILVKTSIPGNLTVSPISQPATGESGNLRVSNDNIRVFIEHNGLHDVAYVNLFKGLGLEKIQNMDENHPYVYVRNEKKDYAIVHVDDDVTEVPVGISTSIHGNYRISIKAKGEYDHLHLIDNQTGVDIDLLQNDTYEFSVGNGEYPLRFVLRFKVKQPEDTEPQAAFAYFANGKLYVDGMDGRSLLQVVDALGHVMLSKEITDAYSEELHYTSGVYIVRIINGNGQFCQKIIID